MVTTLNHHLYDGYSMTFVLFKDIKNAKDVRQCVMSGEVEATLLKTSVIVDPFHVTVAASKAVHLHKTNKMSTKNVHSEVLFCLSPTRYITDSFTKFGLGDSDTSVFVVILNDSDGSVLATIKSKVDGTIVPLDHVSEFTDTTAIKKIYKVKESELSGCCLTDAITSKIASKEFVNL